MTRRLSVKHVILYAGLMGCAVYSYINPCEGSGEGPWEVGWNKGAYYIC